ncbi:iron chelate uptake ABC transporter family permease subunit [Ornithinimicrobium cavernae]|uniref:iron chelate uptake ABC transporter family permease subunit n=1 Tax=Ornithinimicrobium cavernae TaxID=2666047 RepID=UPI000D688458|nr:iron chelate uptake ABC transporter family permease subunit [Ornithinimicrobium cavernae]
MTTLQSRRERASVPGRVRPDSTHASPVEQRRRRRIRVSLGILALLCVLGVVAYLTYDVRGSWEYAMDLRGRQVGSLVVVGAAVGASSLVFQTIAGSRILTPSVMGFDALYLLVQTVIVFFFGGTAFLMMGVGERFLLNTAVLTVFGMLLFRWLFGRNSRNLLVLVLVGIVIGSLFGSLTSLASRVLNPNDFLTLQDVMFATFNTVDGTLLWFAAAVCLLGLAALVPLLRSLDVVDLGYDNAVALGLPYHRVVTLTLAVVTVLVAVSTALVGPMLFLGLIVANLARQVLPTHRHTELVLGSVLVGVLCTVGGQFVAGHLMDNGTTLSVVVNLVGGIYFILLLMRTVKL